MPRPKVSKQTRQRIAKACIHCQSGKQKCDGLHPCAQCIKRERSSECEYSSHVRSYGRQRLRKTNPIHRPSGGVHVGSLNQYGPVDKDLREDSNAFHVAIPRLPHNVRDSKGRAIYFGNSAALSFLQSIQELMEVDDTLQVLSAGAPTNLVSEDLVPHDGDSFSLHGYINGPEMLSLIEVFFTSTCGILDIFNRSQIGSLVDAWVNETLSPSSGSTAILYLVIAYAAQTRDASETDKTISKHCFHYGQQTSVLKLTTEPSIESVQAFLLISLYMLGQAQRNAAHFNLGISLSAARALGYHRIPADAEQGDQLPRRIWRTLCYHDLFFCAMMGRTPSTSTTDLLEGNDTPSDSSDPDYGQQLGMIEAARAFSIMRQTVINIYTRQSVPLGLLEQISSDLQELRKRVPAGLCYLEQGLSEGNKPLQRQQFVLRNASVACDYHFSMMLLMRPFLVSCLRISFQKTTASQTGGNEELQNSTIQKEITRGAMQAIEAAISTIQVIHDLHVRGLLFKNMPLVVARVLVSALTVCAAFFGRLGDSKECELAIHRADQILQHFMESSPQAKHYDATLKNLSKAAFGFGCHGGNRNSPTAINSMSDLFGSHSCDQNNLVAGGERSLATKSDSRGIAQGNSSSENTFASYLPSNQFSGMPSVFDDDNVPLEGDFQPESVGLSADQATVDSFNLNGLDDYNLFLDFQMTESIWDINWDGMLL
ncbi:hypothetical protein PMG11_08170 [Penicillium brasilianum]|uniref:Zn(2)-C6 fungal-type domain-containing protein n=1 Tax=Penicillium brasilianum TaxID=104259 RepID=A0A0F7TVY5_PENBI|nr:hypothetical protein PMG11_08170 [Penicillium brasilianum]